MLSSKLNSADYDLALSLQYSGLLTVCVISWLKHYGSSGDGLETNGILH